MKPYLKQLGVPPEAMKGLFARVDEVLRHVSSSVVDAYKRLDSCLDKSFRVVGKRRGCRKPFSFDVG